MTPTTLQIPDPSSHQGFPVIHVNTWSEYRDLVDSDRLRSWGFRGQSNAEWQLFSSLSRCLISQKIDPRAWRGQEARLLRLFKAKAHLYLDHVPPENDAYQWLSLMQHHGAPTRLLDITWSPYVALFFALERATQSAAVWAFLEPAISERPSAILRNGQAINVHDIAIWKPGCYEDYYLPNDLPFITIGKPSVMNQRLIAQSGSFMVPGRIDEPIEQTLKRYPDADHCILKIVLNTPRMRKESLQRLYSMNITNASLFPDLDGLSRSLAYELETHWGFDPQTMEPRPGFPPPEQLISWSTEPNSIDSTK